MIKESFVFYAEQEDRSKRLDAFLHEEMDAVSRTYVQKLIDNDSVIVEGVSKLKNGLKLRGNEKITVNIPTDEELSLEPENIPLNIVYEDEHFVVINKSHGMVVHPAAGHLSGTLVNAILYHIRDLSSINGVIRPGIVHRLDKDTSGLIIVAKKDEAHKKLADMFKNREVKKCYLAIVCGRLKNKAERIETLIGRDSFDRKKMAAVESDGRNAITNYEVIFEADKYSLLKVFIETGRTHQIRVHMKYIRHPIAGDVLYGNKGEDSGAKRQMLHSYALKFKHPITGEDMDLKAELPDDFKEIMKKHKLELNEAE